MAEELRILFVDDDVEDVEIASAKLREGGIAFAGRRVQSRGDLLKALEEFDPGLVLSDYSMPGFDGLAALTLVRERRPDVPFIFVSGHIGEDRAIEALRNGATDYVLKERYARLIPCVRRALRDSADRTERRRIEEQLRQSQKMEALGQLAGGVAHDFNNSLGVILQCSESALEALKPDDPLRMELELIRKASQGAAGLTRRLLAFSRQEKVDPQDLVLRDVVEAMGQMLLRVVEAPVELVLELGDGKGVIRADRGQVEQVVMNLVVNAVDAMPQGGKLTLSQRQRRMNAEEARLDTGLQSGDYIVLRVSDTGTGMDEATRKRIFDPFFTTKRPGKGTGLGLSIVYSIVKQGGGGIVVEISKGAGSTFSVYWPRA